MPSATNGSHPLAGDANSTGEQEHIASPEYAGIIIRFIASFVDGIVAGILIIVFVILIIGILFAFIPPHSLDSGSATLVSIIAVIPLFVFIWLYYAGFESSHYMATPGKMLCGLKVTGTDLGRISLIRATVRFITKAVPGLFRLSPEPSCACLTLICALGDAFAMYTNDQRQCVHDMIAGTYVISG